MKNIASMLILTLVLVLSAGAQTQQQSGEERLGWAFPVIAKVLSPRDEGPKNVPGSSKTYHGHPESADLTGLHPKLD